MNSNYLLNYAWPEAQKKAFRALEAMEIDLERFIQKTNAEIKAANELPKGPETDKIIKGLETKKIPSGFGKNF